MILTISKVGNVFEVDDKSRPGSPPVGRGHTIKAAIGDWLFHNQARCDVQFIVDKSAIETYVRLRDREFATR